jgi:anti-sigma B factor antagonist
MAPDAFGDGFAIGSRQVAADVVLVEIVGDLDIATVRQADTFLTQAMADHPRHLILDLSRVAFLASSGLGFLLAVRFSEDRTHALHLLGVTDNRAVQRALATTGLLEQFDIGDDLETLLVNLG